MLIQDNFTKENIERLQKISGNDPSLLEKIVYSFEKFREEGGL